MTTALSKENHMNTNGLYISGCGEMGRVEADGTITSVPSFHVPTIEQAFGRRLNNTEMDQLWEMQHRNFLRGPDEVALYEKYRKMVEVVGIEGSVNFGTAEDWIGFRLFLNHGQVRASWEPCAPVNATAYWDAITELVATTGASRDELDTREALVSAPGVIDRHEDLSWDLTHLTAGQARNLLQEVAMRLLAAHQLLEPVKPVPAPYAVVTEHSPGSWTVRVGWHAADGSERDLVGVIADPDVDGDPTLVVWDANGETVRLDGGTDPYSIKLADLAPDIFPNSKEQR